MIIMKSEASQEDIDRVVKVIEGCGRKASVLKGEYRAVIGVIGDEQNVPFDQLAVLPGVKEAVMVERKYKLLSREYSKLSGDRNRDGIVKVGNVEVGGEKPTYVAGPCAVESREQLFRIAEGVKKAGAHILRGGVFKPRSSVHSWQGLGSQGQAEAEEALGWLQEAGRQFDMPTVTEVRGELQVELVARYADILQIGARNMYNQDLCIAVGKTGKPVLYKRSFGAGIEEYLSFAEYIAAQGNHDIILCERGILPLGKGKSFTRYTLDLAAVPVIQQETYLPIIADPSHGTGRRDLIYSMSCASIAAGANGLMIEVHYDPSKALVDGAQMVTPEELTKIIAACQNIHEVVVAQRQKNEVAAR